MSEELYRTMNKLDGVIYDVLRNPPPCRSGAGHPHDMIRAQYWQLYYNTHTLGWSWRLNVKPLQISLILFMRSASITVSFQGRLYMGTAGTFDNICSEVALPPVNVLTTGVEMEFVLDAYANQLSKGDYLTICVDTALMVDTPGAVGGVYDTLAFTHSNLDIAY